MHRYLVKQVSTVFNLQSERRTISQVPGLHSVCNFSIYPHTAVRKTFCIKLLFLSLSILPYSRLLNANPYLKGSSIAIKVPVEGSGVVAEHVMHPPTVAGSCHCVPHSTWLTDIGMRKLVEDVPVFGYLASTRETRRSFSPLALAWLSNWPLQPSGERTRIWKIPLSLSLSLSF